MFCPICKAEYREGFTHCNDCDLDLVPSLKSRKDSEFAGPVLAWRGDDPVAFGRVVAALRDERIPYFQLSDHEQLLFPAVSPRPGYGIFVRSEDALRAREIVRQAIEEDAPDSEARES